MEKRHPQPVEDFTRPALVMILVNLIWIFVALWSLFGWAPVLLLAATINYLINRTEEARQRDAARFGRARS